MRFRFHNLNVIASLRYHWELGSVGTNGVKYVAFSLITATQVRALSPAMTNETNILKRIDEYNYGKHTKGWAV